MPFPKDVSKRIFISYSRKDREWLERLLVHLRPLERESLVEIWDDTKIQPGSDWVKEIEQALDSAEVAVLLISADFLASDYIANHELPLLLAAAKKNGVVILPLILSPSSFEQIEGLSTYQSVNPPSRPLIGLNKEIQEYYLVKLAEAIVGAKVPKSYSDTHSVPLRKPIPPASVQHQQAATLLHIIIVVLLGIIALSCIGGGIFAIYRNTLSPTNFSILGAHFSTGHVGVAFIGIGLLTTYLSIRSVLRSQRDLAALPPDEVHLEKTPSSGNQNTREPLAGRVAKKAALITTSGAIMLLGWLWLWMLKTPYTVEKKKFVGRVSESLTGKNRGGAKVSLEGEGVPSVVFTDSEGIFSFPVNDPTKEVRIRVEAAGCENYDRRITPSENPGTLEIRLESSTRASALSPPNSNTSPSPKVSSLASGERDVSIYITKCRSFFDRADYQRASAQCDNALRLQPKNQDALRLKESIQNTIRILNK